MNNSIKMDTSIIYEHIVGFIIRIHTNTCYLLTLSNMWLNITPRTLITIHNTGKFK